MSQELKPRPLCNEPLVLSRDRWWHLFSDDCPLNTFSVHVADEPRITAWNTRATDTRMFELEAEDSARGIEAHQMRAERDAAKADATNWHRLHDELEAEVDRLRARPKVKPLEWFMPHGAETMRIAFTVLGKYRVWAHSEAGGRWFWDLSALGVVAATIETGNTHSCESAKAAAEADYEARIMSALAQP